MKILLTGATGFLGSNIASSLIKSGHQVIATHRNNSSFDKCAEFKNNIYWINTELANWEKAISETKPDQLIHVAWNGIKANERNSWDKQIQNFWMSKEYFDLAKACEIKKIIAFGSQAEYGVCSYPANEETAPEPLDAYGAVKTLTANYLRNSFQNTKVQWYWIRIFSVFGENENPEWLIPTIIKKLLKHEAIGLTPCEQFYNYLYTDDFIQQFRTLLNCTENKSGIYNLCNTQSIKLKDLLLKITELIDVPESLLHFGAISYRPNQNMMITGSPSKFINSFLSRNEDSFSDLSEGLRKTIEYYKQNR